MYKLKTESCGNIGDYNHNGQLSFSFGYIDLVFSLHLLCNNMKSVSKF